MRDNYRNGEAVPADKVERRNGERNAMRETSEQAANQELDDPVTTRTGGPNLDEVIQVDVEECDGIAAHSNSPR